MFESIKAGRLLSTINTSHGSEKGTHAQDALAQMGDDAVPALLKCVAIGEQNGKYDVATQRIAAVILTRIGTDGAVIGLIDLLLSCLRDDLGATDIHTLGRDADVRRKNNVTWALARVDSGGWALEPLRQLLKDRNDIVRSGAMLALARTRAPQAIEILASVLSQDTETVYFAQGEDFRASGDFQSALRALEQVGPAAIDALNRAGEACWPHKKNDVAAVVEKIRTAAIG